MLTVMSFNSCVGPRVTRTTCVSAFPYWLSPRTMVNSYAPVCRVAVRAQQQRNVQMRTRVFKAEHDQDPRIEGCQSRPLEVGPRVELEPVLALLQLLARQVSDAALRVGDRLTDLLPIAVRLAPAQRYRKTRGCRAAHRVEDRRRDGHCRTRSSRRISAILRCSPAATRASVTGSLSMRSRSANRISSALLPAAAMRKTCPKRAS